jgi:hypothetical protein
MDPHFLDLGASWRWVVSFTPRPRYPRERTAGIHWIGGWVDLRASLNDVEVRKFLTQPGLELRPLGSRARSQSLYRLRSVHTVFFFHNKKKYSGMCPMPRDISANRRANRGSLAGTSCVMSCNRFLPYRTEPTTRCAACFFRESNDVSYLWRSLVMTFINTSLLCGVWITRFVAVKVIVTVFVCRQV